MWASTSSTQLLWSRAASSRHNPPILRHRALAATPAIFMPFSSASAFASASASASASKKLISPAFKKPEVMELQENMPINNATLIGTIVRDMQIQYLDSGKIVAHTSMKVRRNILSFSWFYLEFWDDLAEVAAAHLKIGDRIYVSGSVWQETITGRDGLEKTFAKVVAKGLKFVPYRMLEYAESAEMYKLKLDESWNDLFENRADWIDNRGRKKTERHPDFKHKFLGKALWLENRHTPVWVKERLAKEGSLQIPGF